ncbi:GNAT family N-acetyltransferase [Micromonospora sp. NPDC049089]|uniref:GNAT family N-acetyltransferase n=1 Tax=Micromonospora sp. NPDC049089 TaxID=3155496 RepID=UPI00340F9AC4
MLYHLHTEQLALYGFADRIDDSPADEFDPPAGLFLVAYVGRQPVACGGWRRIAADQAEVKRMFVHRELRGLGLGKRLLRQLEQDVLAAGLRTVRLETGRHNHHALRLYIAAGYEMTAPYVLGRDPAINRALWKELQPSPHRGH